MKLTRKSCLNDVYTDIHAVDMKPVSIDKITDPNSEFNRKRLEDLNKLVKSL